MELKVTRHGAASQVAVLHPGAQVDGRSAFQFEQDVLELLQDGTKYVVVDFAAVNAVRQRRHPRPHPDAAQARRPRRRARAVRPQPVRPQRPRRLGPDRQFTIVGTIADAVKAMPAGEDTSETGQLARRVLKLLSIGGQAPAGASAIAEPVAQELADRAMHALSRRR